MSLRPTRKFCSSSMQVLLNSALDAAIHRLSLIGGDSEMGVHTPDRVAQALQNHGPLLSAIQIDAVKNWLTEQQGRTAVSDKN